MSNDLYKKKYLKYKAKYLQLLKGGDPTLPASNSPKTSIPSKTSISPKTSNSPKTSKSSEQGPGESSKEMEEKKKVNEPVVADVEKTDTVMENYFSLNGEIIDNGMKFKNPSQYTPPGMEAFCDRYVFCKPDYKPNMCDQNYKFNIPPTTSKCEPDTKPVNSKGK